MTPDNGDIQHRAELDKTFSELETILVEVDKELAEKIRQFKESKRSSVDTITLGKELVRVELDLARAGEHDKAEAVRKSRIQIDEELAVSILSGSTAQPPELLALAKRLASAKRFGLGRRLLRLARKKFSRSDYPNIFDEILQKISLYTYKDPDLPLEWRLDRAFEILREIEDLANSHNPETLGLAGAIHKRKWDVDGQRVHLERALFYYLRGYAQGAPLAAQNDIVKHLRDNPCCALKAEKDQGYNGINAAFVLDLLAQEEEEQAIRAGLNSDTARTRREAAGLIREEIVRSVPALLQQSAFGWLAQAWWFYATIGEAHFGLGDYSAAIEWLVNKPRAASLIGPFERKPGLRIPEWEYESTARQLGRLARLRCKPGISEQEFEQTEPGRALKEFLQGDVKAVLSAFRGKFGLALSGGGFRASLFHIGVLARLAELDVLRHLEVLSCVSGGSIVGAHYYLELRQLLETRTDDEITHRDYIDIVQRTQQAFLKGVQRNIRTRVLAEWTTNLRMIFQPGYSRTLRLGELYERELYSSISDIEEKDGDNVPSFRPPVQGPRWMPEWLAAVFRLRREHRWLSNLFVCPKMPDGRKQSDFNPRDHNWRRRNKVPMLILNATTLNTGHNWQFTASFMGEPPGPIETDIDANYRLRRMYYKHAPPKYQNFRLGHAVAASSCVPGLFDPLILDGLYPDQSVRLVDGGVCDNQGVASLLEQDCNVLLVSDASGQMGTKDVPSRGLLGVPLRSNSILQRRVRESQYEDVITRQRTSLLRGLMFIHLKQGLPGADVPWTTCPSHLRESDFEKAVHQANDSTGYDVAVETQRQLADIRTDLDSFSDLEAFALMTSGYQMTREQFAGDRPCIVGFTSASTENWDFLTVADALKPASANRQGEARRRHLGKVLNVAEHSGFKVWRLWLPLIIIKWVLGIGALFAMAWLFYQRWDLPFFSAQAQAQLTYKAVGMGVLTIVFFAAMAVGFKILFGAAAGKGIMRMVRWRETLKLVLAGIGMGTVGFLIARLHLHVFDRLYLHLGRLERMPTQGSIVSSPKAGREVRAQV